MATASRKATTRVLNEEDLAALQRVVIDFELSFAHARRIGAALGDKYLDYINTQIVKMIDGYGALVDLAYDWNGQLPC